MKNSEIKRLFDKNVESGVLFWNWKVLKVCSEYEMSIFITWLNQLNTKELISYVQKSPTIISVLTNLDEYLAIIAISRIPHLVLSIKDPSERLFSIAIQFNPFIIKNVKEQTVDLCLLALKSDSEVYSHIRIVPNTNYEMTLKNLLEKKAILEALK